MTFVIHINIPLSLAQEYDITILGPDFVAAGRHDFPDAVVRVFYADTEHPYVTAKKDGNVLSREETRQIINKFNRLGDLLAQIERDLLEF